LSRLKYKNPFAMGNLGDLMVARESNDVEYLKEWSRAAVTAYENARNIQMKAFEKLIKVSDDSKNWVEEIRQMLKDES